MPPSPTIHLARRLGAVMGLSEGSSGSHALRVAPDAYDQLRIHYDEVDELSYEQEERYRAEVQALYLPSLIRLIIADPVREFNVIHPYIFGAFINLVCVHVRSGPGARYFREHPTDAANIRVLMAGMLLRTADSLDTEILNTSNNVLIVDLVRVTSQLLDMHRAGLDSLSTTGHQLLCMAPGQLANLRRHVPRLSILTNICNVESQASYVSALDRLRLAVSVEDPDLPAGSALLDTVDEKAGYLPWWTCEVKREADYDEGDLCDNVPRDELRTCARCLAVRYCSERHQRSHWKDHKPSCVAPTW